jgi:hypothetical protein
VGRCPPEGLNHLLSGPRGGRVFGDVEVGDTPACMRQHDQHKESAAGERWHD